ncbi:probable crossover junction endonuclease EME2 [Hippopotamus amphibius kiboko]|uniref:probable crossover junction endonuclease EME2 n=1 Tax=Hippopotamus amphibius kiboko TaxID=575201 RepID=UPI002597D447|nr:probable crossover junction endonuclease EME2 [Hippopotamus amphibius kiboko]
MARAGSGRAGGSRRGRGQRRPPTWEISDSDTEGPAGAEAATRVRDPAEELREAAEVLRRLRPEQAVRRLVVLMDPAILEDAGADILMEALDALGCEYRVEPQRPARSLRWSRVKPDPCPLSVPPELWAVDEQDVLLLLEPEEFLQGVVQLTQIRGPTCSVPWITPESPACLHLAVIGLEAYLWSRQPSTQETRQPGCPAVAQAEVAVGWPEVEEALVLLQLWANVDVLLVATWQELSQHVCAFTRALAQRPFKQSRESGAFSFCTAGRWAAGEQVKRDGTGLRGAWWRQIRQFNRVSAAVADAVVAAFPSPRLLQQAYVACGTEQERLALLADLPVKMGEGVRLRRVGPDLSRRICLFLTTTNPDLLLDLGS